MGMYLYNNMILPELLQVFNATKEISTAANYPFIRLFTAALVSSLVPLDELAQVEQKWSPASPGTKFYRLHNINS